MMVLPAAVPPPPSAGGLGLYSQLGPGRGEELPPLLFNSTNNVEMGDRYGEQREREGSSLSG